VPPGGESYAMLVDRLAPFLSDMRAIATPAIVVAHGAVSRVLRGLYLQLAPTAIVTLDEPQHIAFRLHENRIEEIAAAALFSPPSPA